MPGVIDQLNEIISSTSPKAKKKVFPSDNSVVACLSDFHFGVNNKKLLQRLEALTQKLLQTHTDRTKEFVLLLLGDIVDGQGIYPGQAFDLESDAPTQVLTARDALWQMIVTLEQTAPVRVLCVPGNHGRTSYYKDPVRSVKSNWDWVLYMTLSAMSSVSSWRTTIVCPENDISLIDICGHKGLITHIMPPQIKTNARRTIIAGWIDIYGVDFICGGHWHDPSVSYYNGRPIIINGALADANEFARNRVARVSTPTQIIFTSTKQRLLDSVHFYEV